MATTEEKVRVNFVTAFDGKALNNAKGSVAGFEQLANKAAKAFTGIFAAQKIAAFGKASVKAFADDQAAAAMLAKTLTNLGLSFENAGVVTFIKNLEATTGVLDDQLRPAFARLVRQTGDVAKTQTLLNLALDVSAGTGQDLMTVSNALAKAYGGQYTSLSKLGAGLTKADLASQDFNKIQDKLTKLFSGQAASAANSYKGKIDKLNVAFQNLKESVGQGLIDAFTSISSKDGSISKATEAMAKFGDTIGNAITGLGILLAKLNSTENAPPLTGWIFALGKSTGLGSANPADLPIIKLLAKIGKQSKNLGAMDPGIAAAIATKDAAARKAALAASKALADQEARAAAAKKKATADQLALEKASAALKLASKVVDMDQIQLYAAIAQAKSEDLDRLKLQQALLNGNAEVATTLADKILKSNGLVMDLQGKISSDPFAAWTISLDNMLDAAIKAAAELAKIQAAIKGTMLDNSAGGSAASMPAFTPLSQQTINSIAGGGDIGFALAAANFQNQMSEIKVTVDPSAMAYGISLANQNQSSNGTQTTLSRNNPGYFIPQS